MRSSLSQARGWDARLRSGEIEPVDLDTQAEMYEAADARLAAAGYGWYEVSNWARSAEQRCRHNVAYWTSQDWWGIGPGAHSYLGPRIGRDGEAIGAQRWWNVASACLRGEACRGGGPRGRT
ncbi:hypothetical protein GCM10025876_04210 [Demequina litorisediminis]|uniref:Uncharacterized protein n=1 Tax=Demequina litorisediminis TaxID=1849022 RepID=A0ABQ6IAN6_9MICO|nr:hypothetical protein GCM10025876_04210 [Demequina litorisediminis]